MNHPEMRGTRVSRFARFVGFPSEWGIGIDSVLIVHVTSARYLEVEHGAFERGEDDDRGG